MTDQRLVIVSNRGPAEFDRGADGERGVRRGGGGLVTALLGPGRPPRRPLDRLGDDRGGRRRRPRGRAASRSRSSSTASPTTCCMVESDPEAYDRFYNVIANPILWFIQHYLWDLSNAPDIRREEVEAWDDGYKVVNRDIAEAVLRTIEGETEPLVMLHDYHLYTAPGIDPRAAARRLPPALRPHPLVAARQLADPARALARGDLPRPARQRHHRLPHHAPTAATSCTAAAS